MKFWMNVEGVRRALVTLAALSVVGCAGKQMISVSAVTYTYEEGYSRVLLNGQWAGAGSSSVALGDSRGGAYICCVSLEHGAKTAKVQVRQGGEKYFEVNAPIEAPWPQSPNYLAIHLLPGRDVVIELATLRTRPRADLWKASMSRHRKEIVAIDMPHTWNFGPERPAGPGVDSESR